MVTVIGCLLAIRGREPEKPVDRNIYLVDNVGRYLINNNGEYLICGEVS